MNNPFPSTYEEIYYVYCHEDPLTKKIIYIGHGFGDRAWSITNRDAKHKEYLLQLLQEGYLPCDWVKLLSMQLTKASAKADENTCIRSQKPMFNKSIRSKQLKFTPEIYDIAKTLRQSGWSYFNIGNFLNLSTMVIHRGLNKGSISLETALEER